jgi:hypothetical protein
MIVLVIRHKVEDYGTWKAVFDEDAGVRKAHGSRRELAQCVVDMNIRINNEHQSLKSP